MPDSKHRLETRLIHAGEPRPRLAGAVALPIFQSSTYEYGGETDYNALRYIRLNNTPNHTALHAKLASLENAEAALVASSGMAAITTTFMTLAHQGDHILAQDCLYGGSFDFLSRDTEALGIEVDFVDLNDPASWKTKLKANTKAFYVESMTNPMLGVGDLEACVAFSRDHGLTSIIDNTFPSPVNFRPAELGFDLSVHSCSKYLNGHSDLVAGAVIGREELVTRITHRLNMLGGTLDPHACFLLHRGMKTLAVRMAQHNTNALALARALAAHPAVATVNYPGLESHPQHDRAARLFDGFSGMLSFELAGGRAAADRFIPALELPIYAPSLGGVETLITLPATTSHLGLTPEERAKVGITDGLVRVSVGIEATEDLVADFGQALDGVKP